MFLKRKRYIQSFFHSHFNSNVQQYLELLIIFSFNFYKSWRRLKIHQFDEGWNVHIHPQDLLCACFKKKKERYPIFFDSHFNSNVDSWNLFFQLLYPERGSIKIILFFSIYILNTRYFIFKINGTQNFLSRKETFDDTLKIYRFDSWNVDSEIFSFNF